MSNSVDQNPQGLVTDNEQFHTSSPTRRLAADHSEIELGGRSQAFVENPSAHDGGTTVLDSEKDPQPQIANSQTSQVQPENEDWVTLSEIEARYVARVLEHTRGNKQAAARILAVDRKTLDRMIKRHHIDCHSARRQRAKVSTTS